MTPVALLAGAIINILLQFIKIFTKDNYYMTLAITVALSLVGGIGLWYLQTAGLWETVLAVFSSAAVVYQFITKPTEKVMAKYFKN
jgi:hypothetical protein